MLKPTRLQSRVFENEKRERARIEFTPFQHLFRTQTAHFRCFFSACITIFAGSLIFFLLFGFFVSRGRTSTFVSVPRASLVSFWR